MNPTHSTARPTNEYQPTIIETQFLIERLANQIAFHHAQLKPNWIEFKRNPVRSLTCLVQGFWHRLRNLLLTPYAVSALSAAITAVACIVVAALLTERIISKTGEELEDSEQASTETILLNVDKLPGDFGIGQNGTGPVGLQRGNGEGSGPAPQHAQGGGSGGNRTPLPPQVGELPPPSPIPAAIPITALNLGTLPVAGIDLDPALWQDLKAPVYGDPLSTSQIPSKGPGAGEGIGTNSGTGVGTGEGPGFGSGTGGNTGGRDKQAGCCDSGGSSGSSERSVDAGERSPGSGSFQRVRVLVKPEPQYTEQARRNDITGTVVLRVIFSSAGEVIQIRAVRTLPFGLTERAIAAARQIRFSPAMRDGRAVSVAMQLEYNFNLY